MDKAEQHLKISLFGFDKEQVYNYIEDIKLAHKKKVEKLRYNLSEINAENDKLSEKIKMLNEEMNTQMKSEEFMKFALKKGEELVPLINKVSNDEISKIMLLGKNQEQLFNKKIEEYNNIIRSTQEKLNILLKRELEKSESLSKNVKSFIRNKSQCNLVYCEEVQVIAEPLGMEEQDSEGIDNIKSSKNDEFSQNLEEIETIQKENQKDSIGLSEANYSIEPKLEKKIDEKVKEKVKEEVEEIVEEKVKEIVEQRIEINIDENMEIHENQNENSYEKTTRGFWEDEDNLMSEIAPAVDENFDIRDEKIKIKDIMENLKEDKNENIKPNLKSPAIEEDINRIRNKYLIGKIAGEDLMDEAGNIIVAQNSIIDEEIISKAGKEGKLAELIVNMTLPDI